MYYYSSRLLQGYEQLDRSVLLFCMVILRAASLNDQLHFTNTIQHASVQHARHTYLPIYMLIKCNPDSFMSSFHIFCL